MNNYQHNIDLFENYSINGNLIRFYYSEKNKKSGAIHGRGWLSLLNEKGRSKK